MDTPVSYVDLAAHFDQTYQLKKGGAELDYLTTEQVVTRLNTVLGHDGWSFRVLQHGQVERDCWVLGRLTIRDAHGRDIIKEQFGEATIEGRMPIGDVLKSCTSSALKKCASLIGVGLYLSNKEEKAAAEHAARQPSAPGRAAQATGQPAGAPVPSAVPSQAASGARASGGTPGPLSPDQAAAGARTGEAPSAAQAPAPPTNGDPQGKGLHHAPDGELWAVKRFYERCERDLRLERADVLTRLGVGGLKAACLARDFPCRTVMALEESLPRLYDVLAQIVADERERPALHVVEAEEARA